MNEPIWNQFLTERDRQVFAASGCVRATVVDAFSDNYRVTPVEEGCFDRSRASHALSLCDMHAKYADVAKLEDVVAFIGTLPKGLFDPPKAEQLAAPKAVSGGVKMPENRRTELSG